MSTDHKAPHPRIDIGDIDVMKIRWRRTLRFAVGVTSAAVLAYSLQWPLYTLTPVLTVIFLAQPLPKPGLKQAFALVVYLLIAFVLALLYTKLLLPFPLAFSVALGIALFHTYYQVNQGGSVFLAMMSLIAVLVLPMAIAAGTSSLANMVAGYFVLSVGLAVLIYLLAHALFPDPITKAQDTKGKPPPPAAYHRAAAINALKSTLVVWPIGLLFIAMAWSDDLLVMVFVAIFSLSPRATKGREAGIRSLLSTLAGGTVAVIFFILLAAVPELFFFIPLMFVTTLIGGGLIYSGVPIAAQVPSAAVAFLVVIGGSLGQGADFASTLLMRIALICISVGYVTASLAVLDRWFADKAQTARLQEST